MENNYLFVSGLMSSLIGLIHIGALIGGASWYRFLGAGEKMASLAEEGSTFPTLLTGLITLLVFVWALYAFSGAGMIGELPYLKGVLLVIASIYIVRGIGLIPLVYVVKYPYFSELKDRSMFLVITSLMSLVVGLIYLKGWMLRFG